MGEIHNLEPILHDTAFFQGLDPKHVALLAGCAKNVRFNAGELLCKLGAPANEFYVLRQGRVVVEIDAAHKGVIAMQTLEVGEIVGWSWLFPPYRWNFDVRAGELVRALSLDATCLRRKCDEDHDLGYEMMKRFSAVMVDRLQAARLQLLDLYQ